MQGRFITPDFLGSEICVADINNSFYSRIMNLHQRVLGLLSYVALLIIISACGSVNNPEGVVNNLETQSQITEGQISHISSVLGYFPNQTQLSIAVVNDSATAYYGAIREKDTLKTINNSRIVFEIGSMTKVFTSALLADLVQQGKIHLDDPIQGYLEFPINDSLQITFRQLANHSSGLPRIPSGFIWQSLWHMDNPYKDYDEEKLRDYMSNKMELENERGKVFQYSNIGTGILGYVLTQIEGQSYEEMLQQVIFQPLDMQQSTTQRSLVDDKLIPGLNKRGNFATNWDLGALPGAGAILSSAEDMVKFATANFDTSNKALFLQREKTFTVDNKTDIGLGWFIKKQDSSAKWYWHNGGTGGYRSSMVLDVDKKKGVVVLSNISTGHSHAATIDSLSFSLLRELSKSKFD